MSKIIKEIQFKVIGNLSQANPQRLFIIIIIRKKIKKCKAHYNKVIEESGSERERKDV